MTEPYKRLILEEVLEKFGVFEMSPVAMSGEYEPAEPENIVGSYISEAIVNIHWDLLPVQKKSESLENFEQAKGTVEIRRHKTEKTVISGYWTNKVDNKSTFHVLGQIILPDSKSIIGASVVKLIYVKNGYRGIGLGSSMYLSLLFSEYTLVSDYMQYDGARKSWFNFSDRYHDNIILKVFDNHQKRYIEEDYTISDWQFHKLDKYWSKGGNPNFDLSGSRYLFVAKLRGQQPS